MTSVLLFDDSLYILKLLTVSIKKYDTDIQVFTSQTFEEAEAVLQSEKIDIVFIDLQVPGKNGADLIEYLKNNPRLRKIKRVILTETSKDSLLKTSLKEEVDAYLHKEDIFKDFQLVIDQLELVRAK